MTSYGNVWIIYLKCLDFVLEMFGFVLKMLNFPGGLGGRAADREGECQI